MKTLRTIKPAQRLVRRAHAAELLDCHISLLKRIERAGKLKPIRLGTRDVFYRAEQVDALASGKRGARG